MTTTTSARTRSAISATGLRKSFGDKVVLDDIDLTVAEGKVFSLLGPNGAGKTTMVQILSTLIPADRGELRVAGHDLAKEPDAVRAAIGVTGQFSAVDNLLTGQENLLLMADLLHLGRGEGRRRAAALLDRFDLVDAAKKLAGTYSGGMRRRLDLAMTLVGDPRLIFLDEPTTGLDPRSRRTMWQIIRELVADGVTIFLTTQDLDEADQLADRIAVLDRGRIVVEGTPAELKNRIPGGHIRLQFADLPALESAVRSLGRHASLRGGRQAEDFSRRASLRGGREAEDFGRRASLRGGRQAEDLSAISRDDETLTLQVPSDGNVRSLRAILDRLDSASIEVDKLSIHTPDLDDVFFAVTGHASTQEGSQR
jgi:ABC-2 type transport system ATP-binding protein